MRNKAFLSLGSNMGDKIACLKAAAEEIAHTAGVELIGKSSLYTTAPVGYLEQDDFINAVIAVETELSPEQLLKACQQVETSLKRERLIRWGPRTIDVDILWIDGYFSQSEMLTVPHPRMTERAFVMVPLAELNPELVIQDKTVEDWCSCLADQDVRKMTHEKW